MKTPLKLAVLGDPVAHSRSPVFQTAALTALDIQGSYEAIQTPAGTLEERLRQLAGAGYRGLNLTVPLKVEAFDLLSRGDGGELSPQARGTGAVNTMRFSRDRWEGHNTDPEGFVSAAEEFSGPLKGLDVVVLGAGGAARAVVMSLCRAGVTSIRVWNRDPGRLERLLADLSGVAGSELLSGAGSDPDFTPQGTDLLVQTTSLGLNPSDPLPPLPGGDREIRALDLITHATPWQSACRRLGCRSR